MDLYADLPLAKGSASAALGADGKPKASTGGSSVWKSTPLMVPRNAAKPKAPTVSTSSSATMVPSSVKKSPVSIAFKPASVARRHASLKPTAVLKSTATSQAVQLAVTEETKRTLGAGLGFSTVVTEVRVATQQYTGSESIGELSTSAEGAAGAHFFTANYRDEYHPSRPNSYEAFCEERINRQKLQEVKRELDRRQREQEQAGKREREQLVKDLEEGRAPAIEIPAAAGRGRGMTMPAWMRKKIEDSASQNSGAIGESAAAMPDTVDGQFEDAVPRAGLGFSRPAPISSSAPSTSLHKNRQLDEFGREMLQPPQSDQASRNRANGWDQQRRQHANEVRIGCVVLLQNMVGPGEVDDELQDEVREECSEKYGPVDSCVVFEVKGRSVPPEEAVRIFVKFQKPSDAGKAVAGLSGRFFGGRKVQAALFDDGKFERKELAG